MIGLTQFMVMYIPDDIPDPLGKPVTTTTIVDANLNDCLATGRSVTGCLHFVIHTPIDSYSKRQATAEVLHMDQNL